MQGEINTQHGLTNDPIEAGNGWSNSTKTASNRETDRSGFFMSTFSDLEKRPGIRRVNSEAAPPLETSFTPVNQQNLESHVVVPGIIGVITALVVSGMAAAAMMKWGTLDGFSLAIIFGCTFLLVFMRRIGVGDRVLWSIEEFLHQDLDGDGEIGEGYAPRSVPLSRPKETRNVALPPKSGNLTHSEWAQVAIALLNKNGKVSRRGISENCKLSQAKASEAAAHLSKGYAVGGELNAAGFDWLLSHLPEYTQCLAPHPDSAWLRTVTGEHQPTNQPTNQAQP